MIFRLIAGIILLTLGRRLYWLFVGAVAFFFVVDFVSRSFPNQPHTTMLVIAIAAGLFGALLAVLLQKVAVLAGGFFAGGHFLAQFLGQSTAGTNSSYWVLFVVGGIIGAVLMRVAFNLALIVLSSLIGATLVLQAVHLGRPEISLPLILLAAFGIAVQYGLFRLKKT